MKRRMRALAFTLVAALLVAAPSRARMLKGQEQESRLLSDRFNIAIGMFAPNFSTDVAAGFGSVVGTFVRLEDDLGLENRQKAGRLDGFYRFNRRNSIDFGYLLLDRDAVSTFSGSIFFDELTFSGDIRSNFKSQVVRTMYRYSMANTGKTEVGISAGISTYAFDAGLAGDILIDDPTGGPPISGEGSASVSIQAPVPVFGFFFGHAVRRNLIVRGRTEVFGLSTGNWEARLIDAKVTLDWYLTRHFGLGIGWNGTSIDYKDSGKDPFAVNYRYSGLMLFIGGAF